MTNLQIPILGFVVFRVTPLAIRLVAMFTTQRGPVDLICKINNRLAGRRCRLMGMGECGITRFEVPRQ